MTISNLKGGKEENVLTNIIYIKRDNDSPKV